MREFLPPLLQNAFMARRLTFAVTLRTCKQLIERVRKTMAVCNLHWRDSNAWLNTFYPEKAVINGVRFWLQRRELVCRLLSSKTVICSQYLWNENKHTRRRNRQSAGTVFDANWEHSQKLFIHRTTGPIPVVAWYKARVCGHWLAGIAGSNPTGGMTVCCRLFIHRTGPIPVVAQYKARVCGRWLAGISGSNPTGGLNVCLLSVLCVVKTGRSLAQRSPTDRVWLWSSATVTLQTYKG